MSIIFLNTIYLYACLKCKIVSSQEKCPKCNNEETIKLKLKDREISKMLDGKFVTVEKTTYETEDDLQQLLFG